MYLLGFDRHLGHTANCNDLKSILDLKGFNTTRIYLAGLWMLGWNYSLVLEKVGLSEKLLVLTRFFLPPYHDQSCFQYNDR